ncbi:MAG: LamG-like jellyroll fold domain-containing protein, partial [Roseiflexaceae bacterium]|nr:LamG-like jellyroll fold domain-containing protein [Roseiflexaceae bacterium]
PAGTNGSAVVYGTSSLPVNSWSHLAVTYNNSTLRLYLNGAQVASTAASGAMATSSNPLRMGGNSIWGEYFSGRIDNVRIYNRALSATEIQTDMSTPVASSSSTFALAADVPAFDFQLSSSVPLGGSSTLGLARPALHAPRTAPIIAPIIAQPLAQSAPLTRTITYAHDGLQRLTSAVESGATTNSYAYGYDSAGNRTSATANNVTTTRSYNAANQVIGWTYDAAGNLTNDGTNASTYDALNRVTTHGTTSNAYNGDGTLVSQVVGGVTTRYTQDLASPLSQILNDGTSQYVYGLDRLYGVAGSTRTWYASDALGSVRQTLNDVGVVQATANYDPWGQVQSGAVGPFGFTGELQQGSSVYLRARWYNASSGSFGSRDSFAGMAEEPNTLASYTYGANSPVMLSDPSGRCYAPIAFLRDVEPLNCSNLDQAIQIVRHPNASANERAYAGTYIAGFALSHAALLVGSSVLTWELVGAGSAAITTISQWGSSHIFAETAVGSFLTGNQIGLGLVNIGSTIYQASQGNPDALTNFACPEANANPNLWNSLAEAVTAAGVPRLFAPKWRSPSFVRDLGETEIHAMPKRFNGQIERYEEVGYSSIWRGLVPYLNEYMGTDSTNLLNFVGAEGQLTPIQVVQRIPRGWKWRAMQEGPGIEFYDPSPVAGRVDSVRIKAPDPRFNKSDFYLKVQLRVGRDILPGETGDQFGKVYMTNTGAFINASGKQQDLVHINLPFRQP